MFGKWLYSDGKQQYGTLATCQGVLTAHERFHKETARLAEMINAAKHDDAANGLSADSEFSKRLFELTQAITQFMLEISRK
jgi:hypothetical protein